MIEKKNIFDQIMKFKHKKAARIFKAKADFLAEYLYMFFNEAIESSVFLPSLKQINITPVFKKGSILSILSKQLYSYFGNIKFQFGFGSGFSTQHC